MINKVDGKTSISLLRRGASYCWSKVRGSLTKENFVATFGSWTLVGRSGGRAVGRSLAGRAVGFVCMCRCRWRARTARSSPNMYVFLCWRMLFLYRSGMKLPGDSLWIHSCCRMRQSMVDRSEWLPAACVFGGSQLPEVQQASLCVLSLLWCCSATIPSRWMLARFPLPSAVRFCAMMFLMLPRVVHVPNEWVNECTRVCNAVLAYMHKSRKCVCCRCCSGHAGACAWSVVVLLGGCGRAGRPARATGAVACFPTSRTSRLCIWRSQCF